MPSIAIISAWKYDQIVNMGGEKDTKREMKY